MKLLNTNKFYLNGTENRFAHIATVQDGFSEYMAFIDLKTNQCYIEKISSKGLEFIEDDILANELKLFLDANKILDLQENIPMLLQGV